MTSFTRVHSQRFPRTSQYHPEWIMAGASGGAHCLWLAEWLTEAMPLRPGMRVLDLGCGRAMSSIFLHREFGAQVWAVDLWFDPAENLERIRDAGAEAGVFPLRADARALPFATGFFDAIVSVDSLCYYGTDESYLGSLARYLKPGGRLGIAQVGLTREFDGPIPPAIRGWWEENKPWGMHSAAWWRGHWERAGILDLETADTLPDGWRYWAEWIGQIAPDNGTEISTVEADAGEHLGYVRVVGQRRADVPVADPIVSIPAHYVQKPLLRDDAS